jgi:hypothetical protein
MEAHMSNSYILPKVRTHWVLAATCSLTALCAGCATQQQSQFAAKVELPNVGAAPLTESPASPSPQAEAQAARAQEKQEAPSGGDRTTNGDDFRVELARYIRLDRSKWPQAATPNQFQDLYTQLFVESDNRDSGSSGGGSTAGGHDDDTNLRDYSKEKRFWLERLFLNRNVTITTLANADVSDPDMQVSLPLFSVSRNSSLAGETFVTSYTSSHMQTPLFRVRPNSTLTIHLNGKISNDVQSQATAAVLKAVQTAVSVAAPGPGILTTLSKQEVSNSANAIDKAIGGLLSQDITEDIELGRAMGSWSQNAEVAVKAYTPWKLVRDQGDSGSASGVVDKRDKYVGTWRIKLTCPRVSYFDTRDVCSFGVDPSKMDPLAFSAKIDELKAKIVERVDPEAVLQEPLSSQVSVQSFVQTQSWYTDFLSNISNETSVAGGSKPGEDKTGTATQKFCANVMSALYSAGLSRFDASLVLRAMSQQMPGVVTLPAEVGINAKTCGALVDPTVTLLPAPPATVAAASGHKASQAAGS